MEMKYKLLFIEILIGAMLGYACGVVFADTPMANLRLSTDMNGGGHSITNLDTISVSNEPWATPSEVTNIVTSIGGGGGIGEESDPVAYPVATNALALATATNNPNHVTAAQVGALATIGGVLTGNLTLSSGGYFEFETNTYFAVTHGLDLSDVWVFRQPSSSIFSFAALEDIAGHNADTTAHAGLFAGKQDSETIYTGAVCPASEGTRYYWASGTNVALSVGTISDGGTVNIAKLNNTATNSITAIGKAGWVWTGGDTTNTITAGKSMTFGFLVDPSNGKTNAYATGVSK